MRQVVLGIALALSSAPIVARAQEPAPKHFTIAGTWDLNVAKSEEPQNKMRRGYGGGGMGRGGFGGRGGGWGGRGGRGGGGRPEAPPPDDGQGGSGSSANGMRETMTPAYRLMFAQSDSVLTITVPGNSIRRIRLDRPELQDTSLDGRVVKIKTKLEEKKLTVERESEMGKTTESYEFDKDTGELVIKTKVTGKRGSFDFKRVYVKAKDQ
jgi:hypothetical protein